MVRPEHRGRPEVRGTANRRVEERTPQPAGSVGRSPMPPFVGRADALAVLDGAWARSLVGGGELVLVGGEAGAGKTRLAAEFARSVRDGGAAVLRGTCEPDLAPPHQPWVQVLEQVLEAVPALALPPALAALVEPAGVGPPADAALARARLHAAFAQVLAAAAHRGPTLVVLDDLHWAGPQTLAVLGHLARTGPPARTVVLGTFRDTGDERGDPLDRCLADLRRHDTVTRLPLAGLDEEAVERFVAGAVGHPLDADLRTLARELADRSGGNAFLLGELWRHLVGAGAVAPVRAQWAVRDRTAGATVPAGVREVVAARLRRLSPAARGLVELAAVAGRCSDLEILAAALGTTPDALDAPLDELLRARLLAPVEAVALVHRFEHAVVRESVESGMRPIARRRAHLALAEALEQASGPHRGRSLTELARHLAASAPLAPPDKAVRYALLAAAQATDRAAHDEAAAHLDAVLTCGPTGIDRARVLVALAAAGLRSGAYGRCRDRAFEAVDAVADLDEPEACELLAEAAVLYAEADDLPGPPRTPAVALVRRAVERVGADAGPAAVRLQASLGRALAVEGRVGEAVGRIEVAVARAREIGDVGALLVGLRAAVTARPDPRHVLDASVELQELAERHGELWSVAYGSGHEGRARIALGELDGAADAVARMRRAAETGRYPLFRHLAAHLDAVLALAAGDLTGAERNLALAASSDATAGAGPDGVDGLAMVAVRRAQGRLADVLPVVRTRARGAAPPVWGPALAACYAELGRVEDARAVLDTLAPRGFAAVPRDPMWPACAGFLAEGCVRTGARAHADALDGALAPFAGTNLTAAFTLCLGPADRLRAGLHALAGRPDEADACFRAARALARRSGSRLWEAEVLADRAAVLATRGDAAGAARSRARAEALAGPIGLALRPGVPPADVLSEREREVLGAVAAGLSNRGIAARLFISEHTVANHVRAILRKTGSANRTEAAARHLRGS